MIYCENGYFTRNQHNLRICSREKGHEGDCKESEIKPYRKGMHKKYLEVYGVAQISEQGRK